MQIAAKHPAWLLISLATGGTLIFYFIDAPNWLAQLRSGRRFGNALGLDRRLHRHHLRPCRLRARTGLHLHVPLAAPSGRDLGSGSLHGELPRLSRRAADVGEEGRRAAPPGKPAGDCVDCNLCVTVCPIGIDIREGPNFACINCGLCVDACDGVMSKLGRPRGLIDYESWNNIERGRRAEPPVFRPVRPKTVGLTAACLAWPATIVFAFAAKTSDNLSVQHDRDPCGGPPQ